MGLSVLQVGSMSCMRSVLTSGVGCPLDRPSSLARVDALTVRSPSTRREHTKQPHGMASLCSYAFHVTLLDLFTLPSCAAFAVLHSSMAQLSRLLVCATELSKALCVAQREEKAM